MKIEPDRVYTAKEVSELLQIAYRSVLRYCAEGKIPAIRVGKFWRVYGKHLLAFLEGLSEPDVS